MIKNILNEQFKDLISEETLNELENTFQLAVEEKASEKIKLEKENVTQQLDESYTQKLQTVIEKIDQDHTTKLKKLVEAIDTDHAVKLQKLVKGIDKKYTSMLNQVIEKHEKENVEEAKNFQGRLVEEISNYLDLYIDKALPKKQISEAVENIRAVRQLEQIRQIVGISEEFVDGEIKEALVDGKKTIDSLRSELNSVLKENANLALRTNKAEAHILLEKKTTELPTAKKAFIVKLLGNKNPGYIEENFDYVVSMFEKESQDEVELIKESVHSETTKTINVDRPTLIEETQNFNNEIERNSSSSEGVSGYLNEMKKLNRFAR
jgi:hypothetical protein